MADLTKGLDGDREQDGLGDRDDLGLEILLVGLGPESGQVGRDHNSGDDIGASALEGVDLRGEVIRQVLEATGVDDGVTALG